MKPRPADPRRLDVEAFARAGSSLAGEHPLAGFERLADALMPGSELTGAVQWQLEAAWRRDHSGRERAEWRLRAQAEVPLQCQRCLGPMVEVLALDRSFAFATDEDEAARLDEESDEDMLVLSRRFDLIELLEDELILALPLVPRHELCPEGVVATPPADPSAEEPARENPFQVLATWRHRNGG